jgi:hypothetical protein
MTEIVRAYHLYKNRLLYFYTKYQHDGYLIGFHIQIPMQDEFLSK